MNLLHSAFAYLCTRLYLTALFGIFAFFLAGNGIARGEEVLLQHDFTGSTSEYLHGKTASANSLNDETWQSTTTAATTFRASGEVQGNSSNVDRGAWLYLGEDFFQPNTLYSLKLGHKNTSNAVLYAGFQYLSGGPNLEARAQTQGNNTISLVARNISGGVYVGVVQNTTSEVVTRATTLGFVEPATDTLFIDTKNLTNAVARLGDAQVTFNASNQNYLFIGFEDNGTSSTIFTGLKLSKAKQLLVPAWEDFNALLPGDASNQLVAQVSDGAQVTIVADPADENNQCLAIVASTPPGCVVFNLAPMDDVSSILWFETTARASATTDNVPVFDLDGVMVSLVKENDRAARFYAYDGKQGLANGGGQWKPVGDPVALGDAFLAEAFSRITIRADYNKHRYDVFIDGDLVAVNLGFDDASFTTPTALALCGNTVGVNYFDAIYLSSVAPESVPFSSAGDGISDVWKIANGIDPLAGDVRDSDADGNGLTLIEEYLYGVTPGASPTAILGKVELAGGFLRDVWLNIEGKTITQLKAATNDFQKTPDLISLTSGAEAPRNWSDNYGQRLRGYITLPEAGTYTFYLNADDTAELWISRTDSKWERARTITATDYTNYNIWTKYSSQRSAPYTLPAGHRLYVEIRHKEGTGADHVQLGWTTPSQSTVTQVPAEVISSYVLESDDQDDDDLPDSWEVANGLSASDNGFLNPDNGKYGVNNTVGLTNHQCWKLGLNPKNPDITEVLGKVSVEGVLQREVWEGISGNEVTHLVNNARFAQTPNLKTFTPPEGFINVSDNYGERWRGWLTVPTTGDYRFRISSDDTSQLWLSTDDTVINKRRISQVQVATTRYQNKYAKQSSLGVTLEAGRRYYIEVLHKEGTGADHCTLSWVTPEDSSYVSVPAEHFSSWVEDASLDQIGYSKAWLAQYNILENSILPFAYNASASLLNNWESYRLGIDPASAAAEVTGAWIREIWQGNLRGDTVDANRALFLTTPQAREVVQGGDGFTNQLVDGHIDRTRGYLVAPETGWYRFGLSSDDDGEFWLSTDSTVGAVKCLAYVTVCSSWDNFANQTNQISAPVYLEAGKRYYAEVRHYENAGNDFVQLVWATPSQPNELNYIPASAMATYAPPADDPHGWGYPASWLAETGLDQLSLEQQAPWADPTGGGLTNLEKYKLGLNPLVTDTDGDGVSDYEEVYLSFTNPREADFDGTVTTVAVINGADYLPASDGTAGAWQKTGTSAYAAEIRGTVAYTVTLTEAAASLRLKVTGGQYLTDSAERVLVMDAYVGAAYAGRITLKLGELEDASSGVVWLPVIPAGTHTVKLVWINGVSSSSLRVDKLELQLLGGDWITARQNALSTLDETPAVSYTSPYCLEGGAPDVEKLTIATTYIPGATETDAYSVFIREKFFDGSSTLAATTALRGKYYTDFPLSPTGVTSATVTDAAVGVTRAKTITWRAYDLAEHAGDTRYLRAGDALLLKSAEPIVVTQPLNAEPYTLNATEATPFVFTQAGTYTLTSGDAQITVHAITADLGNVPTCLVNEPRAWTPTILPQEACLESDSELLLYESLASTPRKFTLLARSHTALTLLARLGELGPILDTTVANTLIRHGNAKEIWDIIQTFNDGTELWRGQLNFSGMLTDTFRVVISSIRTGVQFADGSTTLELTAADFDENGIYTYYLLLMAGTGGAPCHRIAIYDGDTLITTHDL